MVFFRFALAAFVSFGVFGAHAADPTPAERACRKVDLDGPRGPLRGMPIFAQPMSDCFAHEAVELAEAWRRSHPPVPPPPASVPEPQPGGSAFVSSPLALTARVAQKLGTRLQDAKMSVADVLEDLRQNGSCDHAAIFGNARAEFEAYYEAQLWHVLEDAFKDQADWESKNKQRLYATVLELEARHPEWSGERDNLEAFFEGALDSGIAENACHKLTYFFYDSAFPKAANGQSFTQLLAALLAESKSANALIAEYFDRVCRGHRIPLDIPAAHSFLVAPDHPASALPPMALPIRSDSATRAFVDKKLDDANPQPIGVDLCADVLLASGTRSRQENATGWGCADVNRQHAVVIVGREWDPKKQACTYKIRNSEGTDCTAQNMLGIKCDERGQIWVDATDLIANTYQVNTLGD